MPNKLFLESKPFLIGAMLFFPIAFFAALPWLKSQPDSVVFLVGGVASIGLVAASLAAALLNEKKLDEWHRSAQRFSLSWGQIAGGALFVVLISIPQTHSVIASIAGGMTEVIDPDKSLVMMAYTMGFMTVVAFQAISALVLAFVWKLWMSRAI